MNTGLPICRTCGVQYGAPREDCPICLDERQYVGWDGQQWTTLAELAAAGHRGRIEEEGPGVLGVGTEPATAIGQRALLVTAPGGNVLWDMITYLDDELAARIRGLGGISAIAISHPHFYGQSKTCVTMCSPRSAVIEARSFAPGAPGDAQVAC